jgi:NADP-dependent 3-hydroxy acid dehydrogenase YdfG
VAEKYKTIDVLINNAGVSNKKNEINEEVATWTFATVNFVLGLEFLWYDQFY